MSRPRSIAINGDLGSGKSTVAVALASRLGWRRISMGDIYRRMAEDRGMTTLQLNRHSERDRDIDAHVDRIQRDMASSDESMIVDSRLGWFFFVEAFKVHLITDPVIAAGRVMSRPADKVESYSSIEEAERRLRERSESERARFIARYHVDKARLRNYDLICDTTAVAPEEATLHILDAFNHYTGEGPSLLLDPSRLYPTEQIQNLRGLWQDEGAAFVQRVADVGITALPAIEVGYDGSRFFIVDGHRRVSAALQANLKLVRAELVAEVDELVVGDLTARQFFQTGVRLSPFYDWQAAHSSELALPPHLVREIQGQDT